MKMVAAYHLFTFPGYLLSNSFVCRQTKIDRIRRRQITSRPFLRPEKYCIRHIKNSDYFRFDAAERGTLWN
jgi:hypothetical protein